MRTLKQINAVYEKIMDSDLSDRVKSLKLQKLLNEMVRTYSIPANPSDQNTSDEVIALYRKISENMPI
ncbi:hypothetical protein [Bacillus sp. FJAT-27251]|uniref:hypothetical protein n=1 Tax=Bacillus sp. FJAT-27251 TaxID=1684142 RepID=UPI0006A7CD5F|nr:hypothetical protein [Bacillus sp. FJAT-27251]